MTAQLAARSRGKASGRSRGRDRAAAAAPNRATAGAEPGGSIAVELGGVMIRAWYLRELESSRGRRDAGTRS